LSLNGHKGNHHISFSEEVVKFDRKDASAKVHGMFEKTKDLVWTLVIARQRAVPWHMPDDRGGECFKDSWNIPFGEVIVRLTDGICVGRVHDRFRLALHRFPLTNSFASVASSCRVLADAI